MDIDPQKHGPEESILGSFLCLSTFVPLVLEHLGEEISDFVCIFHEGPPSFQKNRQIWLIRIPPLNKIWHSLRGGILINPIFSGTPPKTWKIQRSRNQWFWTCWGAVRRPRKFWDPFCAFTHFPLWFQSIWETKWSNLVYFDGFQLISSSFGPKSSPR